MAELVDAESQGVVRAGALGDHLCPMVVQLALEAGDLVPAPSLGRFEALKSALLVAEPLDPASHLVSPVAGSGGIFGVGGELALRRAAPVPRSPAKHTKLAHGSQLAGGMRGDRVHGGQ